MQFIEKLKLRRELRRWRRWPYENTTLLILSMVLFFYLAKTPFVDSVVHHVGDLGYIGAFITGIFFVSTFTAAPAGLILYNLADSLHPIEVALLAGLGAMVGDYIIFRVMKDKVFEELKPVLGRLNQPYVKTLFRTPFFVWLLPVIGAFIIASPLPDEAGISLLGISKIKKWQFFIVTYTLNVCGIFLIAAAARL